MRAMPDRDPSVQVTPAMTDFRNQVHARLEFLYSDAMTDALVDATLQAIGLDPGRSDLAEPAPPPFSEDEVMLITYGDSLVGSESPAESPLATLAAFVEEHLHEAVSTVHVLPFFPSSSDGGFAVVDYKAVEPTLGTWSDIEWLSAGGTRRSAGLMVDLIVNHGSSESEWFQQFLANEEPGRGYYKTIPPGADISQVVRPRTHDLAQKFDTPGGQQQLWCTFSRDQIDFDFSNPDVLLEFLTIVDHYLRHGATRLRLDAVGYVWKEFGSPSIHLPQTHELVKLLRTLLSRRAPEVLLVTETNVPHDQNISYFGDQDEAQVVYNFSLVPLALHSVLAGDAQPLTDWASSIAALPPGTAFLNFLASHDGLGMRPAEGLLSERQIGELVYKAVDAGGDFSSYTAADGERPYELNVSLADLLLGKDRAAVTDLDIDRYLGAHAIILAFKGIPAIYIHSLLATPGDHAAVVQSGHKRDVNRPRLDADAIAAALADPQSVSARVVERLCHLIGVRRRHRAFSPDSPQQTLEIGSVVFALRRGTGDDAVLVLQNVTDKHLRVDVSAEAHNQGAAAWRDLLVGRPEDPSNLPADSVLLSPYQARWLVAASAR